MESLLEWNEDEVRLIGQGSPPHQCISCGSVEWSINGQFCCYENLLYFEVCNIQLMLLPTFRLVYRLL